MRSYLAAIRPSRRNFQLFKYVVYVLLGVNVFMFMHEEWLAIAFTHTGGLSAQELIRAFPATIDTAAWVVLLLLFELETSVIPDEKIVGRLKLALHGVRALCYVVIVYAFYGYLFQCIELYGMEPVAIADLCGLAGTGASFLLDQDVYAAITAANCNTLPVTAPTYELAGASSHIVTDAGTLAAVHRLNWTDVINSGDWLFVVALLELDVRLQLQGRLRGRLLRASQAAKIFLYSILLVCAIYWGFAGDFIDFWDAFLWLVAFVFIEMNIFEWHDEAGHKINGV